MSSQSPANLDLSASTVPNIKSENAASSEDAKVDCVTASTTPPQAAQDAVDEKSAAQATPQPKRRRVPVRRAPEKSKWNAENIMVDSKSPLATCDLRTVLSNPMAWDILDAHEKAEILALFPDREHIIKTEAEGSRPNFQTLLNDDSFRHDCATYTENVAEGRHDPEWLAEAWAAHGRRKAGDFDEYLTAKFEEDWAVKLPDELKPQRAAPITSANEQEGGEDKAAIHVKAESHIDPLET
ncbi:hypothetical protein HJFPF1_11499 [Paramyrothecium foliicola]|nr:hypothetical protein HJFPF1_11499 [Paramyrothecium foliicola]